MTFSLVVSSRTFIDSHRILAFTWIVTADQLIEEFKTLPSSERVRVAEKTVRELPAEDRKSIERLLRRLQHPDVPEDFWRGVEDHEDDRTVDMETALHETPPSRK